MTRPIRVIVIERETVYRRGLGAVLSTLNDFEVIGFADTVDAAYGLTGRTLPDVAFVSTTLADAPGLTLVTELRRRFPTVATIVIAASESDDELFRVIRAGAFAYCGRDISEEALLELARRAATGEYVINEQVFSKPYVAARVLDQFRNNTVTDVTLSNAFMPLTNRELEILRKVSDGMTNAEIGVALEISAQTVKNHVTSILHKLAVNDRTQAVVTALRRGWLTIEVEGAREGRTRGVTTIPTSQLGSNRKD